MQKLVITLLAILIGLNLSAQDRVKVMVYNLLNYGNVTSYCTQSNNNMSAKNDYNAIIADYIKPDILGVVEMGAADFAHQRFLDSSLNVNGVSHYAKSQKMNTAGSDIISLLYYNEEKFGLAGVVSLQNQVRDIVLFRLYYKSPNLAIMADTAFVNCIVAHLKSSSSSANQTVRNQQVTSAMNYLSQHFPTDNYLFMGDFNIYKSSEAAYQTMTNYSNSAYQFYDPINTPGNWNNNSSFAAVHTQSTHSNSNGCAAGGGLDDRFDFIMISDAIKTGSKHISYVSNSYVAIGNDGNHFNKSINYGTNNSVPANVLDALYHNSDHLPLILELDLDNTIAGISDIEKANNIRVRFENPINDKLKLQINSLVSQDINIQIYDLQGRSIYSQQQYISGSTNVNIDLSTVAKGLYIIQVIGENNERVYSAKLIKK
ncbi:MAG: T9SS type A sorting domain-containing protein [Bacteroidales bacterium]|nr:T9SS type A sorting domain-containing protein [Bacteroidales bacterium]